MNTIRVTAAMAITAASLVVSAAGSASAHVPEPDSVRAPSSFDIAGYVTARKQQIEPQSSDAHPTTALPPSAFDLAEYLTARKVEMSAQRAGRA
jgi:hypothetical protein